MAMAGKTDKSGADKVGAGVTAAEKAAETAAPIEVAAVAAPAQTREKARRPAAEAGPDLTGLPVAYRAFAEAVIKGQRRNTLLAAGAAGGSVVALVLAGLVYFQSVEDLRIAADVQAEAAKLLVEEVKQIDVIGDVVTEQQDVMKTDLLATLELVKDEIRRAAMTGPEPEPEPEGEPMDAQIATAIREGVKADLDVMRDEILTALAEAELALLNGTGDPEMTELLEAVKALVAEAAPPAPVEAAARSTAAAPAKPRPKPQPQPAEPNPFTYP
jgi:hypothetical protein